MYFCTLPLATVLLGWLSLSLPALSISAQEPPRALTLDESCRIAFEALATENYALLLERFPTASEMQTVVDSHLAALSPEQQKKSKESMEARGGIEVVRQRALATFEKHLRTTRAEVAKRLTWSNASYLSALPLVQKPQKLAGTSLEMVAVEFLVWAEGEVWAFGARDVVHGPRGYMFSEFVSFLGPRAREKSRDNEELFKLQEDVTKLERSLLAAKVELTQAEEKLAQMSAMAERDREYATVLRSELEAREANYQEAFDRWRKQEGEMRNKLEAAAREAESAWDEVKLLEQKVVDRDASAAMREEEVALEKYALAEELRHAEQHAQAWEFRAHVSQGEIEHLETGAQAVGITLPRAPQQWLREIPAWIAPVADEPSWRSSLRSRLSRGATFSNGETPVAWILEYLRIVSQARFVLFPSLSITAAERRVLFDTAYEDLAALLERAVEPSSIRVHEGNVFIGTTEELSALDHPFWTKATTTEVALQGELTMLATSWNKLHVFTSIDKPLEDVLQMAKRVYEIDLWYDEEVAQYIADASLELGALNGVGFFTFLQICAHRLELRGSWIEGVLVIEHNEVEPFGLPTLDPTLLKGIEAALQTVDLEEGSLAEHLEQLSELFSVELRIAEALREDLEDVWRYPVYLKHASLSFVLRSLVRDHGSTTAVRWMRSRDALVLSPSG